MSELSLDDQLKRAEIAKSHAETRKLEKEAKAVDGVAVGAIKLFGSIVLGLGGLIAAYSQHEISEMKAKTAQKELEDAVAKKEIAIKEQQLAVAATQQEKKLAAEAVEARKAAERATAEAIATSKDYKNALSATTSDLKNAKPDLKTRLVYVHFRGDLTRTTVNALRAALKTSSFNAPAAERVPGEYGNLVKYFRPHEKENAEKLKATVEAFFATQGCPLQIRVVPPEAGKVLDSPLEVWLAHKCNIQKR